MKTNFYSIFVALCIGGLSAWTAGCGKADTDTSVQDGGNHQGDSGVDGGTGIGTKCGDGAVEGNGGETCDDGNTTPGDGCNATCGIEPGWGCPQQGGRCVAAACGDGLVAGDEQCDDGDADGGDGCDTACALEWGFACPAPGEACVPIICGDGKAEGLEQCDDGNYDLGDGCNPFCEREPDCANGVCTTVCGDNIIGDAEACDDGNKNSNDGCSPTCQLEAGFECTVIKEDEPETILLPVVYRDFKAYDENDPDSGVVGHIDFQNVSGDDRGIVQAQLAGTPSKPAYNDADANPTVHDAASFAQWYRTDNGVNMTVVDRLTLTHIATNTYVFDDDTFFPLDGRGFNGLDPADPFFEAPRNDSLGDPHNFYFTSEVRYWFEYSGDEVLDFRGDDDVFVFINGHLAVDIGGVHVAQPGSVTLADQATAFGLLAGGIYEAVVFQAERRTVMSSYKLTLTNFLTSRSVCVGVCGNGVVTPGEQCDDGNTADDDGCDAACQHEQDIIVIE